jgi:hypothetical protein
MRSSFSSDARQQEVRELPKDSWVHQRIRVYFMQRFHLQVSFRSAKDAVQDCEM